MERFGLLEQVYWFLLHLPLCDKANSTLRIPDVQVARTQGLRFVLVHNNPESTFFDADHGGRQFDDFKLLTT